MNRLTQFAMRLMFGFLLSLTATTLYSQTEEYSLEDPKWKEYIMDGVNSNYVWARQIAPTKLAIGLLEGEGYLSLENDTCIWFRDRSYTDDQLIAIINVDQYNGNYLFFSADEEGIILPVVDTIGIYNPNMESIFDKRYDLKAVYTQDGQLRDTIDNIVLLKTNEVNKILSSFYFLSFYLREKEIKMNITKSYN